MNLNILARKIASREGKKVQVNIAQIKEVLRCTFDELFSQNCFVLELRREGLAGLPGLKPIGLRNKKRRRRRKSRS